MKPLKFLLTVALVCLLLGFGHRKSESSSTRIEVDDPDHSLARVHKLSGKYVFVNSEPIHDYDVVFEVNAASTSLTWDGFHTPDEMMDNVLKKAFKVSEKESIPFDGLIMGSGKKDVAITFK